jgi:hypothetical protein
MQNHFDIFPTSFLGLEIKINYTGSIDKDATNKEINNF